MPCTAPTTTAEILDERRDTSDAAPTLDADPAGYAWHPDEEELARTEADVCAAIQSFCANELTAADAGLVTGPSGKVYVIEIIARLIPLAADTPDDTDLSCVACGQRVIVGPHEVEASPGVAHHLTEEGTIDFEADADHVAVPDGPSA